MKIILLRHGRPEVDFTKRQHERVSAFELKKIVENYRWAKLAEQQDIPDSVIKIAIQCKVCVTSDIVRSIESAQYIIGDNIFLSDPIYRESEMAHLTWQWPKLSMKFWFYFLRILWFLGYKRKGVGLVTARKNAKMGTKQLVSLAQSHGSVLLVGHGININLMAKELIALGWTGSSEWTKDYWNYNQFILE